MRLTAADVVKTNGILYILGGPGRHGLSFWEKVRFLWNSWKMQKYWKSWNFQISSEKEKFHEIHDIAKHQYFLRNIKVLEPPDSQNSMISINFMDFMKLHKISWFFGNFMIFVEFYDFLIKNGKRTLPRATTRGSSPNHCNYKQIHRSRRGVIRPKIMKMTENHFFRTFRLISTRNWKSWWFSWNLGKFG